ncbi:MAG: hypothetical protein IT317_11060 [Anaerolineales bacterium]|nr:hypothetical protein [Anaerolineales bacterium]
MTPLRPFASFALTLALLLAACAPAAPVPDTPAEPATDTPVAPTPGSDEPVTSPTQLPAATPGTPVAPAWAPQPGDAALDRGTIYLDVIEVFLLESYPVQVQLHLEGSRPTPCHQLRVAAAPPDTQGHIVVEVYTVTDPGQACTQQLAPLSENINLGSYPSGSYTVIVNGKKAAEIVV